MPLIRINNCSKHCLNETPLVARMSIPTLRFRNIDLGTPCKPLYANVKTDTVTVSKIKTNGDFIALPDVNGNSIGILKVSSDTNHKEPIRLDQHCPLLYGSIYLTIVHGKPIQEFEFSHVHSNNPILASTTKTDCLVRLWNLPTANKYQESFVEQDAASAYLTGHEKKIDWIRFHSNHSNVMATSSR